MKTIRRMNVNSFMIALAIEIFVMAMALTIVGNWMMFEKAGKPGWHSIIPFLNVYDEFSLCWKGVYGIIFLVGTIAVNVIGYFVKGGTVILPITIIAIVVILFILHIKQSFRLAKSFGMGTVYGFFLVFFNGLAKIILGLGDAQYVGRPCEA